MESRGFNKLHGKHVLFIGGSTGLGHAAAQGALTAGALVTIASSSAKKLELAKANLVSAVPTGKVHSVVVDLMATDLDSTLAELRRSAVEVHGPLDHIVYTASDWFPLVKVMDVTQEQFIQATHLRSVAPLMLAKHIAGGGWLARNRHSSLVLTGGNISLKPTPGFLLPAYIGAGMEGAVRALALELAPIRVNIVAPGFVDTGLWGNMREKLSRAQDAMVLTGRAGQAEDVAEAYLYLLRDANVTGQVIRSESGATLLSREAGGR